MGMEAEGAAWSPYLVGALIGVLSMATFYFSDKPLGVSTSYARLAGLIGNLFSKGHTETLKFYQDKKPKIEWEVMLMFGVILGAFLAAFTGGELTRRLGACSLGGAFRRERAAALGRRIRRRGDHGLRRAARRRLHQRPRHQRRAAAFGELVDRARVFLRRRGRDRHAALCVLRPRDDRQRITATSAQTVPPVLVIPEHADEK